MRPVCFHFLNLSIADPQRFGVEWAEREQEEQEECEWNKWERMEWEQTEQERIEQGRIKREWIEQERIKWEWIKQEQVEQEQVEQEQVEQEQVEQEQVEQEWVEQEQVEQEQKFLFRCLMPVKTGYHCKFRCMDSTCKSLLNQITDWVANKSGQEDVLQRNAYWFYGSPGIRKMSLAHSICKPSQAKPPCWSVFLPEGQPKFERAHKHPSHFHP